MSSQTMALQLDAVSVQLGGKTIVKDVSLTFGSGRLVVLAGPNGAGKTTLLRAMAGLIPATGAITINQTSLTALSRPERARRMAYLPQGHQVHWSLTARDVVALGRYPHGLNDPSRLAADHARAIDTAMERTDTLSFAGRSILELSGGERARVMLARVLAVEAPIVLADEPTASLDPRHQITVMHDLKAESRRGALVIVVTHDIWLASRIADEIVLMDDGQIIAHGPPHDVLTDVQLAAVYGVRANRQQVDGETLLTPMGLA
jgi:iron complex transport system ATP-binding protein